VISNPYIILGIVAAWLASLYGVGAWQNKAGHTVERAVWQERENTELVAANAKILKLEETKRAEEHLRAQAVAAISTKYEQEKSDAAKQNARDIADARSGALRLRINAICEGAPGSDAGQTPTAPGQRDAAAGTELPSEITADLFALADDADEVVKQLTACQEIVRSDRK
jgi:hypothetical protein